MKTIELIRLENRVYEMLASTFTALNDMDTPDTQGALDSLAINIIQEVKKELIKWVPELIK